MNKTEEIFSLPLYFLSKTKTRGKDKGKWEIYLSDKICQ